MSNDPIMLTRGELFAISILLKSRERTGVPAFEEALASAEKKLEPLSEAMWNSAFSDLSRKLDGNIRL